jgi:hypothetical protein
LLAAETMMMRCATTTLVFVDDEMAIQKALAQVRWSDRKNKYIRIQYGYIIIKTTEN